MEQKRKLNNINASVLKKLEFKRDPPHSCIYFIVTVVTP